MIKKTTLLSLLAMSAMA
jgi:hypothetical protein